MTEVLGEIMNVADALPIKKHQGSRNRHVGSIVTCDYAAIATNKPIVERGRGR